MGVTPPDAGRPPSYPCGIQSPIGSHAACTIAQRTSCYAFGTTSVLFALSCVAGLLVFTCDTCNAIGIYPSSCIQRARHCFSNTPGATPLLFAYSSTIGQASSGICTSIRFSFLRNAAFAICCLLFGNGSNLQLRSYCSVIIIRIMQKVKHYANTKLYIILETLIIQGFAGTLCSNEYL